MTNSSLATCQHIGHNDPLLEALRGFPSHLFHDLTKMTRHEALTLALELAITATNETDKDKAVAMADNIAAGMPDFDIEQCKAAAVLAVVRGDQ